MAKKAQNPANRKAAKKSDPDTLTVTLSANVAYAVRVGAAVDEMELDAWIEWALLESARAGMDDKSGRFDSLARSSGGSGVKIVA